ncbi:hypothetical protein CDAR_4031, partial [Caerostris darwini]
MITDSPILTEAEHCSHITAAQTQLKDREKAVDMMQQIIRHQGVLIDEGLMKPTALKPTLEGLKKAEDALAETTKRNQIRKTFINSKEKICRLIANTKTDIDGYTARIKYLQEFIRGLEFFHKYSSKNKENKTVNSELKCSPIDGERSSSGPFARTQFRRAEAMITDSPILTEAEHCSHITAAQTQLKDREKAVDMMQQIIRHQGVLIDEGLMKPTALKPTLEGLKKAEDALAETTKR